MKKPKPPAKPTNSELYIAARERVFAAEAKEKLTTEEIWDKLEKADDFNDPFEFKID